MNHTLLSNEPQNLNPLTTAWARKWSQSSQFGNEMKAKTNSCSVYLSLYLQEPQDSTQSADDVETENNLVDFG